MQLSNKHRPGLWDLFCNMRGGSGAWQGQWLVQRACGCGGRGGAVAADCPAVSLNVPMLAALLEEYYRQRYVYLGAGSSGGEPSGNGGGGNGSWRAALQSGDGFASGGGSVAGSVAGSMDGSMDGGGGGPLVWDEAGLAAAAAAAGAEGAGGEPAALPRRSKGPAVAQRGMDPQPDAYLQVGAAQRLESSRATAGGCCTRRRSCRRVSTWVLAWEGAQGVD